MIFFVISPGAPEPIFLPPILTTGVTSRLVLVSKASSAFCANSGVNVFSMTVKPSSLAHEMIERMRPDDTVFDEEEGAACAFGDESRIFAIEKRFRAAFRFRFFLSEDGAEKIQRLDVAAQPADVLGERE